MTTDIALMSLSQSERDLAAEIGFDDFVLEAIKQESQVKIQKLLVEREVYLKDNELNCLNEVLPQYYLDFNQDIYGAYNYAGNLLVGGLSVSLLPEKNQRQVFFKLKQFLTEQGYIIVFTDWMSNSLLNKAVVKTLCSLFRLNLKIAIFKGNDILDLIKIYQIKGWSHNQNKEVSPQEIVCQLKTWQDISEFDIISISNSNLIIEFTELPLDVVSFAQNIYEFCPKLQNSQKIIQQLKKNKSLYLSWD